MKPDRRTHVERSESTRAALVQSARSLFTEKGYAKTSTPEIVVAAQVTRGAMYHHFADKTDLFFAVAMQYAHEVADQVARGSSASSSPLDALLRGAESYLAAMAEHGRARLLLLDSPSVLTVEQRLQLNVLSGEKELRQGLADALPAAVNAAALLPELTALVSAAFDHATLAIAAGASPEKYKAAMRLLLSQLIRPPA